MIKKKKPMAARGKTTRKGKVVKALKSVFTGVKPKVSPKTKAKQMQALMKKMKKASPGMKKAITGSAVGMGGAGLMAMARKLKPTGRLNAADLERVKKMMARRIKPTGRLNAADMERVKKMMGKQKGGKMTSEQLKKIMGTQPFRKPISPPGMKPVLDSKGNPVKNLFQKDNRPKRRIMRRKAMQSPAPKGIMKRPKK